MKGKWKLEFSTEERYKASPQEQSFKLISRSTDSTELGSMTACPPPPSQYFVRGGCSAGRNLIASIALFPGKKTVTKVYWFRGSSLPGVKSMGASFPENYDRTTRRAKWCGTSCSMIIGRPKHLCDMQCVLPEMHLICVLITAPSRKLCRIRRPVELRRRNTAINSNICGAAFDSLSHFPL